MLVFLMCSERSGSTLVTKMMDAHRDVCGPSPKPLFKPVVRNFFRYEPLDTSERWSELVADIERLVQSDFAHWKSEFSREGVVGVGMARRSVCTADQRISGGGARAWQAALPHLRIITFTSSSRTCS